MGLVRDCTKTLGACAFEMSRLQVGSIITRGVLDAQWVTMTQMVSMTSMLHALDLIICCAILVQDDLSM